MGDKSPKSKQRDKKQKDAATTQRTADAKTKQLGNTVAPPGAPKGRK